MIKENPAPNIESIWIDQDHEYYFEEVLRYAKEEGYDNFATAQDSLSREFLPSGDILKFCAKVIAIAVDLIDKTKNPTRKSRLRYDIVKISGWMTAQENHKRQNGRYATFPTNPEAPLSAHLKK